MEKLVDVHAHLDDEQFEGEVAEIVSRAKENGVEKIITNGTNVSSSKRAVEIFGSPFLLLFDAFSRTANQCGNSTATCYLFTTLIQKLVKKVQNNVLDL